jgi:hypothetical protein
MAQTSQSSRNSRSNRSGQSGGNGRTSRSGKVTTDPREIQRWAEKHGGHPARVKGTGRGQDPGILRVDFPGFSGEGKLEPIEWDQFFRWFEANELALVYRDKDRFNKIVSRDTVAERLEGTKKRPSRARPRARASAGSTRARASAGSTRARASGSSRGTSTSSGRTTQRSKRTSTQPKPTTKRPRARAR